MRELTFKYWLVEMEDPQAKWKSILLGYLNLDPVNGLSQTLDTMNKPNLKRRLQGLGEFAKLPAQIQQRVLAFIDGPQSGTVGDLIRQIASEPRLGAA